MDRIIFLHFSRRRGFWRIWHRFSQINFSISRTYFQFTLSVRDAYIRFRLLGTLLRQTPLQLLWAVLFTLILSGLFSSFLKEQYFVSHSGKNYTAFLAALTSVGGVFIGLYYTAVSVIGGSAYAKEPSNVRDLLARELVGNTYMRYLATFISVGIGLLVVDALGIMTPPFWAMPLMGIGLAAAVIVFVGLGSYAFKLFDPTTASYILFDQLHRCYRQVMKGGYGWSGQTFPKYAHRNAIRTIESLTALSESIASEPHLNGEPFTSLCKSLISFLCHYEIAKKSIPTDSLWYRRQNHYPDWYRTDDLKTSLAFRTATMIEPQSQSDLTWVESRLLPVVYQCLETNIGQQRFSLVSDLVEDLDSLVCLLAREQQVEFAYRVVRETSKRCGNLFPVECNLDGTDIDESHIEDFLVRAALVQSIAMFPINLLLASLHVKESERSNSLLSETYGQTAIRQRLRKINWTSKKTIYKTGFGLHVLPVLESLYPKMEFERKVERDRVSDDWYLLPKLAEKEAKKFVSTTFYLYEKVPEFYDSLKKTTTRSPRLTAMVIAIEWQYWHKSEYFKGPLNALWDDLNSGRHESGETWPQLNPELLNRQQERKEDLLQSMSKLGITLAITRPQRLPDFAGQFMHIVREEIFNALEANDCPKVKQLFRDFFYSSFMQYGYLRSDPMQEEVSAQNELSIRFSPLMDLMDLSGYALLFSELHDDPESKSSVTSVWNEYLERDDLLLGLKELALLFKVSRLNFMFEPHVMLRTQWQQRVGSSLRKVPRGFSQEEFPWMETARHESPLIRVCASSKFFNYKGSDIFVALYIRKREDGRELDFGTNDVEDLERLLQEEIKAETPDPVE